MSDPSLCACGHMRVDHAHGSGTWCAECEEGCTAFNNGLPLTTGRPAPEVTETTHYEIKAKWQDWFIGISNSVTNPDDDVLTFDTPEEAVERVELIKTRGVIPGPFRVVRVHTVTTVTVLQGSETSE